MMRHHTCSALLLVSLVWVTGAKASLYTPVNGMVYDPDLNITWLVDANLGAGSAFDDGYLNNDGLMSWASANSWAQSLVYQGIGGWRLPSTAVSDNSCSFAGPAFGTGCTGSELGHMYYVELGAPVINPAEPTSLPDPGPFQHLQADGYWSGTAYDATYAYVLNFGFAGQQAADSKALGYYAWAVHDGNVAAVPAPAAAWLLATGVVGLLVRAARRR